ncbi:pseudouridine synthase [Paenibacillus turpanensis]|uniref:pseudouridine synthase n=1 Tax=Paenibacillus turpanensis TaxID=2689078 RepID=UPI00140C0357|nr:pseudouridine synthase [Paenibacillus turpanensis]
MKQTERLDKILSHMGHGTRSELKKLVKSGAVTVNGIKAKDSGIQVHPVNDRIEVYGEPVIYREFIYLMMNKPQGVVSATEDNRDRTVIDLLPKHLRNFEPFPVGRLDKDTEGFLLLTNDGQLAHQLLSPKKHVPKTYFAEVEGKVDEQDVSAFRKGVTLEDGYETMPAELRVLSATEQGMEGWLSKIELTIMEGKFHQVKRMFLAVGKRVRYLKRLSMGPLSLDKELKLGQFRELAEEELNQLRGEDDGNE